MAARPVKIAFLADTGELTKGLGKAEAAMDDAAATANKAGDKIDRSFSGVADAADGVASSSSQAAGGLGDLGGALSLLPGPLGGLGAAMEATAPAIMGVTGAADLLNLSTEKFPKLAKVSAKATGVLAKAKRALGLAIRFAMGPVGLIILGITALVALFVTLYKKNEKFRNFVDKAWAVIKKAFSKTFDYLRDKVPPIVNRVKAIIETMAAKVGNVKDRIALGIAVMRAKFETIRTKVADVITGVRSKFDNLVGFIGGLPGRIRSKAAGMWDSMADNFKGMINRIIGWWNNLSFHLDIPNAIPGLPNSFTISTPNIPALASGGIVTRPTLALIGEGAHDEAVIPLDGRHGFGNTYVIKVTVAPTADRVSIGREIVAAVDAFERAGGRRRA